MNTIAAVKATAIPVSTVKAIRRRAGTWTTTPVSGASTATARPAMVSARPSQLAGEVSPGRPTPTVPVRYTEKTNTATVAFMPVDPQSHSAQAATFARDGTTATLESGCPTLRMRATISASHYRPPTSDPH